MLLFSDGVLVLVFWVEVGGLFVSAFWCLGFLCCCSCAGVFALSFLWWCFGVGAFAVAVLAVVFDGGVLWLCYIAVLLSCSCFWCWCFCGDVFLVFVFLQWMLE